MGRMFFAFVFVCGILSSICFAYSGGGGTSANPYQIATKADLLALAAATTDYGKYFILTADIDLLGETFTTAIIAPDSTNTNTAFNGTAFTGTFDGDGYKIMNFTINGGANDFLGLFGKIDLSGVVKNLVIENGTVTGGSGSYYLGGLAGCNRGTLNNCCSNGAITCGSGSFNLGGLVGYNYSGILNGCYSTGDVTGGTGSYNFGGLVGYDQYYSGGGSISNCYSTGDVSGPSKVGGLVGLCTAVSSSISFCYSTGVVTGTSNQGGLIGQKTSGTISNCFWDTQTSSQATSTGGTGKLTAQMQTLSTFTSASWDFVNETANGINDYWAICEGTNYPRLVWQIPAGDWACPNGIDVEDLGYFVQRWLLTGCTVDNNYCGGTDMDSSGAVNMTDLTMFAQHWLEGI